MTIDEASRRRVENGLRPAVEIAGRPVERHSLVDRMRRYATPGVSISVVDGDEIAWTSHHGEAGNGRLVDDSTLFQAASISKAVAAVAMLALVEAGDLDLDTDVNSVLRGWRLPDSTHVTDQPVTLRRLLSHTAGTTVPGFPGYPIGTPLPSTIDVLSGRGNTPAVESFAAPGALTQYSGGGSTIVQLLVEETTGRPFGEVMRDLVLGPFAMNDSGYEQPIEGSRRTRTAVGHDAAGNPVDGGHHVYPELQAAGLWTTSADLARWVIGVQRILRGDAKTPISRATAEAMIAGDGPFGLGPEISGEGRHRRFGHSGSNEGFRGQVDALVHAASGAAILVNGAGGTTLMTEIRKALADELDWGPIGDPPIVTIEPDPRLLDALVGRYHGPFGLPLRLETDGTEIWSPAPYGRRRMLAIAPSRFLDEETGATLVVETSSLANGTHGHHPRVTRIAVFAGESEIMAFTPESERPPERPPERSPERPEER